MIDLCYTVDFHVREALCNTMLVMSMFDVYNIDLIQRILDLDYNACYSYILCLDH